MSNFFEELKRRNVIKATIAYLVVAWIVIQVAQAVLPTFGAPAWAIQLIIIILAIGLPIWVIISWIYDITPEGIAKTTKDPEKQLLKEIANKRLNVFLIVSLSLAVIVMGLKLSNVFSASSNDPYSIAVMPFVNMSDDTEQEYFSDGLSEELINQLALNQQLKVIGRTSSFSFKGKNEDLREIGRKLGASFLVEGSVRKSGNVLRITAQLINAADGYHLFSKTFDRELKDIFAIQDEIAQAILDAVKIELLASEKEVVFKRYTDNIEAYELYLKAQFHVNKYTPDSFLKAIELFDAAIAIDPYYAIAYAGKSFCYMTLRDFNWMPSDKSLPEGLKAAEMSIQLDDKIAESHLAIGRILLHYDWNIKEATIAFNKAIAINPSCAECYVQLSFCSLNSGNNSEAIKYANIAESLDPLSLVNLTHLGFTLICAEDYPALLQLGKKLVELEPNYYAGHYILALSNLGLNKYEEAIREIQVAVSLNKDLLTLGALGSIYGLGGDKSRALSVIEEMKGFEGAETTGAMSIAQVYLYKGDFNAAYHYYNSAIENRGGGVLFMKCHLNSSPEFMEDLRSKELLEKRNVIY